MSESELTRSLSMRDVLTRLGLALTVGIAGGYAFLLMNMPLPWMLGAMTACTVAALAGVPVGVPPRIRPPMTAVIGVMIGAQFTPTIFANVGGWLPTLVCLSLFISSSGALCALYFRKVGGFDSTTAFFAGMPGGFVEMVTLTEHYGGRIQAIALVHSARILLTVLTLPLIVQWLGNMHLGARTQSGVSMFETAPMTHVWLVLTAVCGFYLGKLLRLPAGAMMGPFILSAIVHVAGITDFKPSYQFVNGAQLVLGAFLGSTFFGARRAETMRMLGLSIGATAILALLAVSFAFLATLVSDYEMVPLILAYSPGGLTEMSLISLALQIEVAFVTCHHFVRITLVVLGAGYAFRLINPAGQRPRARYGTSTGYSREDQDG